MEAKTVELLNKQPEMIPDLHDGSYELMREIINSYGTISDYSVIDNKDFNAIYSMAVGTWKINVEKKKIFVNDSHLSRKEKERITILIDRIWDKACKGEYTNHVLSKPTIGMFGDDSFVFDSSIDNLLCQRFIKLLVDISGLEDNDQIIDLFEKASDSSFDLINKTESTAILHCLKPYTFMYLDDSFYEKIYTDVISYWYKYKQNKSNFVSWYNPNLVEGYIKDCRLFNKARNEVLVFRNLRILDMYAREYDLESGNRYIPSFAEYDPGITAQQYIDLFHDEIIVNKQLLDTIYYISELNDEATCSQIAAQYGNTAQHYNANATHLARAIHKATNCPLSSRDDGSGDRYWSILFQGRYTEKGERGDFSWRLRMPLVFALYSLWDEGFFNFLTPEEDKKMAVTTSKNTILYGPPGTGKTFNTVLYAVAIVENKAIQEIQEEATSDYKAIKDRFENYKNLGRIAFTTFHQSYGYEEFIEGIRPVMDDSESKIEYAIKDGVFKDFCNKASVPDKKTSKADLGLNSDPYIWKVSLCKTRDNPIRQECMEKDHIRVGFNEYPEDLSEVDNITAPLNAFYNKMEIGDIVLSCYTNETIDAIGVITGDVEYHKEYDHFNRLRKVKWLVKGINENIVALNGGSKMVESTVYQMKIALSDVLSIVEKYTGGKENLNNYKDNYVFIVDEINRGNISKIFGELITLVEENKRIGAPEELRVKLPYSHQSFGVPKNVYILGTMNTADRSIAIMDTALRRRFSFVEMLPDSEVLRNLGNPVVYEDGISLNVADMLDIINDRITFLYDREHTIGHAFFMPLKKFPTVEMLAQIFRKSIIPLLQEYFYEDYAKIQLVLGDDGKTGENQKYQFIRDTDMTPDIVFETMPDMESVKKYEIQYSAFEKIESYKLISKKL